MLNRQRGTCRLLSLLAGVLLLAFLDLQSRAEPSSPRAAVRDFTLRDSYGQERSLSDFGDSRLVVAVFLGTECPLAKLYAPRLETLRRRFQDRGVTFLGINSNAQDKLSELQAYRERHQVGFPLLKDPENRVANQFGAERTPEAFVLDEQRTVRYRGRIDDQYGVGYSRPQVTREDLAVALEELLSGQEVSTPVTNAVGCYIGRVPEAQPRGEVTYADDIARVFNERCVECHRNGEIAPFSLASYEDVEGWGETIAEVIRDGRMPPWSAHPAHGVFKNDARLTADEKQLVFTWIESGMPEGDPARLPPPPKFVEGWRIPEPDQVVYIRDEPFTIPAEGVVDYQYFEVDPGFSEDKYIWAAEARPQNRAVVHHIIVYIKPPGGDRDFFKYGAIDGYAPGSPPARYDGGRAMRVPAGSTFVFEMHYTPNGSVQRDRSYVGFKFLKPEQVTCLVRGAVALNEEFRIPPGADNHKVTARQEIPEDVLLLNMTPHMHVRGKSFTYEAIYPDGKRETLLDVPRYDFNWQLTYELDQPKLLPKGTEIFCTAYYDNSDGNPVNPDPTKEIRWGDQSWDEMMIGFFDVVAPDTAN